MVDTIIKQYGPPKIIKEPAHILDDSSNCITPQSNLIIESDEYPSLYPNCHHQVAYAKFNLQIHFPPPYSREIWHYKDENTEIL